MENFRNQTAEIIANSANVLSEYKLKIFVEYDNLHTVLRNEDYTIEVQLFEDIINKGEIHFWVNVMDCEKPLRKRKEIEKRVTEILADLKLVYAA